MNSVSINEHYTEDHDRLDELFHQFQALKLSDLPKATHYFQEFKSGLERHIVWEEEIVFPAFEKRFGEYGGPTEVMRWEHREIRNFLEELAEKLARNDTETEVEEVGLQGVLCPHNHKEENIVYPMIDQVTEVAERKEIFARMGSR